MSFLSPPNNRKTHAVWPRDLDDFRALKSPFFAPQNATAALSKTQRGRPSGRLRPNRKRQSRRRRLELGDPGQNLGVFAPQAAVLLDVRPSHDSLLVDQEIRAIGIKLFLVENTVEAGNVALEVAEQIGFHP